MSEPAQRYRRISAIFTDRVLGVPDGAWDDPSPCPGWAARDVVDHLVSWSTGYLRGAGVDLPAGPPAAQDPVGAWQVHTEAVQALFDDPGLSARTVSTPVSVGRLDAVLDAIFTTDVFLHTWDLARATGQDERLDAATCEQVLAGSLAQEEAMRASGHFGPAVQVPADADVQTRLLAFIGRDVRTVPSGP
ncbi:TIGR03086 family metal-binding protein [Kineococcus sp. SYSU DK003]|uniref:TIGR03086 family metal-binding protein n=1 Tax=Kineococcus sp. SYSU DK003 TaxID=3383124 RepID=UPI003D7C7530